MTQCFIAEGSTTKPPHTLVTVRLLRSGAPEGAETELRQRFAEIQAALQGQVLFFHAGMTAWKPLIAPADAPGKDGPAADASRA